MDPESTIVSAFQAAPNLAEIWPFPINALSSDNQDQHIPINHHLQHIKNHAARKRRDDDESAKGVSTSGNALVFLYTNLFLFYIIVSLPQ